MSETNNAVAIMNQVPGPSADVRGESPLHHVGLANITDQSNADAGVVFREVGLLGHLTLRCEPSSPLIAEALASIPCMFSTLLTSHALTSPLNLMPPHDKYALGCYNMDLAPG